MYRYWGKTYTSTGRRNSNCGMEENKQCWPHLLVYHCLDVAAVGWTILQRDSFLMDKLALMTHYDPALLQRVIPFFLCLHDIGKFSIRFQGQHLPFLQLLHGREEAPPYNLKHDQLGFILLKEHLFQEIFGADGLPKTKEDLDSFWDIFSSWIRAFAGHHGVPPAEGSPQTDQFEDVDIKAARQFAMEAVKLFFPDRSLCIPLEPYDLYFDCFPIVSHWLAGLVILCDWIGSDQRYFQPLMGPVSLEDYFERVKPTALQAVQNSGIWRTRPRAETGFTTLFPGLGKSEPTPLQRFAERDSLGQSAAVIIIEDSTGSGKTEAALLYAHKFLNHGQAQALFIALPTMATSNAMYERMANGYRLLFADDSMPSLVLAHSSRQLIEAFQESISLENIAHPSLPANAEEEAGAYCALWLSDNKKKAFLASMAVGTIDQVLLAVLPSKHQALRLLGLGRGVLIVDEVHAYDPYQHTILCTLLQFHAAQGGSVILLSATLPQKTKQELLEAYARGLGVEAPSLSKMDFPMVTRFPAPPVNIENPVAASPAFSRKVQVELVHRQTEVLRAVEDARNEGACVCWVRNTVDDALGAYEKLKLFVPEDDLILFHARFVQGDRQRIEENVLNRFGKEGGFEERRAKVVIATQVIEQSLDIDFDLMISDLAPMEYLIQRAGRCCRHKRDYRPAGFENPHLIVFSPALNETPNAKWFSAFFPKASYVYPFHGVLWLTAKLLAAKGGFHLPDDARELVEYVHGAGCSDRVPAVFDDPDGRAYGKIMGDKSYATANVLKLDLGYQRTTFTWLDDVRYPTRLGEETTRFRLCHVKDGKIVPFYAHDDMRKAWALSELSVRSVKVSKGEEFVDDRLDALLEEAKATMPDRGKWCEVLIMQADAGQGWWTCYAVNTSEERVRVCYDSKYGLTVQPA